ncbi:MAG: hypothetical protein KF786_09865 [Burkholderiaceae bacterium]|nr:hypothetical protein [Burkholderiaceae bacterium]
MLKMLDRQILQIDHDIDEQMNQHFKAQRKLDGVKGVGAITTLTLLSALPELGKLGRKQIAKLVGVCLWPRLRQATWRAAYLGWAGRCTLDAGTATSIGVRYNPVIVAHYQRLLEQESKKVAWWPARKLLTILNAMMRDNALWDANRHLPVTQIA